MKTRMVYADGNAAMMRLMRSGIGVIPESKLIEIDISSRLPGIRLWGAIDYLCRFCGFEWRKVDFQKRKKRG